MITPCQLCATAYSMHLQLPYISYLQAFTSIHNLKMSHAVEKILWHVKEPFEV
jgi:hypothetical protein